ncbi:MAG: nucleotidyltransferase domain-containing protein [Cyanobacteriota bacterium]|nr:nucleotidyltransferase domain-containing protein [Cyanobacteriota bacterium]
MPSATTNTTLILRPDLQTAREPLVALCEQWQIIELACFGSVLRDDFRPDSDIDLLVSFADTARITFFDLDAIERQFSPLFDNRPVDVVTRRAIEQSHNPIRRHNILSSAQILYRR